MFIFRVPRRVLAASLLALAGFSGPAAAQSSPVDVDCSFASNFCTSTVNSPSSPTPLRYLWFVQSDGTDAVFPQDCSYQDTCSFWCPRYPGPIFITLEVRDAAWQLIGSDSTWAVCTQQDVVLP